MTWPEGLPIPYVLTWPTVFYDTDTGKELARENGLMFVARAIGVVFEGGPRYRVADAWMSFDKRGRFDLGMHVFLSALEDGGDEDRLARIEPDYFR